MLARFARVCTRHGYIVLALWIVLLIGVTIVMASTESRFKNDYKLPDTESKTAMEIAQRINPEDDSFHVAALVVRAKSGQVSDPAVVDRTNVLLTRISGMPHVGKISSFTDPEGARQISADQRTAFVNVQIVRGDLPSAPTDAIVAVVNEATRAGDDVVQFAMGGGVVSDAMAQDIGSTEIYAVIAACIVLLLVFGSVIAAAIPLLSAIVSLGVATAMVSGLTHVMNVADFTPALASLLSLGVGIDYALFIVSRHRANLRRGMPVTDSIVRSIDTSGRAVLVAGITVCISLLGLLIVRLSFLNGATIAASLAVLLTLATSLTIVPAILQIVGMRVLSKKDRKQLEEQGPQSAEELSPKWYAWVGQLRRHRYLGVAGALAILVVLAIPAFSMRLGSVSESNASPGSPTRVAYELLSEGFGPGFTTPLVLTAEISDLSQAQVFGATVAALQNDPGVAAVTPPIVDIDKRAAMAVIYQKAAPQSVAASKFLDHLRDDVVPSGLGAANIKAYVGGEAAIFADFADVLTSRTPAFALAIIGVASMFLLVVFRSLLIPLTASLMNVFAAAAAFGIVVAVFQWGWGLGLFGVPEPGPILVFLPVMLFAILFGLSMDYEVFLISRIHEEWVHQDNNAEAIALGQAESGRVITAAAAIMVVVFLAFVFGENHVIKLFGLGLAAAVFIDAMIIRTILIPSLMHLFGRANWYLPAWLDRSLPRISVEPPESK